MKTLFLRHNFAKNCDKLPYRQYLSTSTSSSEWKSVVGLEVHAQLDTKSKLFSGARNSFGGVVNSNVALLDASIPGTLPVLNRRCVELGIITALALSCRVNPISSFDRKHYFYADLPAGYQITQQRAPLASDGVINFQVYTPGVHRSPYRKSSRIKQLQLEQDSGKSLHDASLRRSLLDLNRAGAPLMELVFEPDLQDGEEAAALVKELLLVVRRAGACSGRMEEGALRVDANVSLHRAGRPLGTRTEIKNIGSVRGVAGAIRHEICRQRALLAAGGVVAQETRAWDAAARVTVPLRDKETAHDYRYMPEPNLPPLRVNLTSSSVHPDIISVPQLLSSVPELPEETRQYLITRHRLRPEIAIQLVNEPILLEHFNKLVEISSREPVKVANILINEFMTVLNKNKVDLEKSNVTVHQLGEIVDLLTSRKINLDVCRSILEELLISSVEISPSRVVEEKNWGLVSSDVVISELCVKVIENNPKLVNQYKSGKTKVFRALLGIIAKDTQIRYDMSLVSKKLEELLKK